MDLLGQLRNRHLALVSGRTQIEQEIAKLRFDLATTDGAVRECAYWLELEEERCKGLTPDESARPGE